MNAMLRESIRPVLLDLDHVQTEEFTDDAIIQALNYGHADWAIEQLYIRYKQYMYRQAYRILRDSYLAEDVVQEVFFTLWYRAVSYQKDLGGLKCWLQTIVRNRALDKVRSAMYREHQFASLQVMVGLDLVSEEPAMWQRVWGDEQACFIRKALEELPLEQLQVIELSYFAGYSHATIARQLQIPVGTVKGRIRLALQKMKPLLRVYDVGM